MRKPFVILLFVVLGTFLVTPLFAQQIAINEIMYHPVEKAAFNTNSGLPVLDLSKDVYEFIELHNYGRTNVALAGWTLSGGLNFQFPSNAVIRSGQFIVVARDRTRLLAITSYRLASSSVFGPYEGTLSNSGERIRLKNADGDLIDSVTYSSRFPWAIGADALGADQEWTGIDPYTVQYKGRSLERVSYTWSGDDPANWLASAIPGSPSPGSRNPVTREIPRPVVTYLNVGQDSNGAKLINPNEAVRVEARFSNTNFSKPSVEWFIENIEVTNEVHTTNVMTLAAGTDLYSGIIPGKSARSIIRYRILADRGTGVEPVSPRPDDPFKWHSYYVLLSRAPSTNAISYDIFVSQASLTRLNSNISQSPRRVTGTGDIRTNWNATEPAIFVHDGRVWDVQFRYHGSRYRRSAARQSYKVQFPDYDLYHGQSAFFVTDKSFDDFGGHLLFELAGLPTIRHAWVDLYLNNNAVLTRLRQEEYGQWLGERYHKEQKILYPHLPEEEPGEFYKCSGLDAVGGEGPYGRGDARKLTKQGKHQVWERYYWTYSIQNNGWKGSAPVQKLFDEMWAARGDTPEAPAANLAKTRKFLEDNFDIEANLNYIAVRNWGSPWDDIFHNWLLYRRSNGKWYLLPWDMDEDYGTAGAVSAAPTTIFDGESGDASNTAGVHFIKDSFMKAYRQEFVDRMFLLNHTLLHPLTIKANGLDQVYRSTQGGIPNNIFVWSLERFPFVDAHCQKGPYLKPATPSNVAPANGSHQIAKVTLQSSAYAHESPLTPVHTFTTWQVRSANSTYKTPVVNLISTNLLQYEIPAGTLKYGETYFWRCIHLDPEKHPSDPSVETSFIFGHPQITDKVVINEVMADNRTSVRNGDDHPDWIELFNKTAQPIDVSGYVLTDEISNPSKFVLPENTTIPASGYLQIWADSRFDSPGLHTGFGLNANGQKLYLLTSTNSTASLLDQVRFGIQAPDFSVGRVPNGTGGLVLNKSTPGAVNEVAPMGAADSIKFNEWMANPRSEDGWLELVNTNTFPVAIGGIFLTDDAQNPVKHQIPPMSFMGPRGFLKLEADGDAKANELHLNFKLRPGSGELMMSSISTSRLDYVFYGVQALGVSQGRLPDGDVTTRVSFPGSATSGSSNFLPLTNVVINELLTSATAPYEQAIELYNPTSASVSVGGWFLSDDELDLKKFLIPGTTIAAGGYAVFYQNQLADNSTRPLRFNPANSGTIWLAQATGTGSLTGYRIGQRYGASQPNVSQGWHVTSVGKDFVALSKTTFGKDTSGTVSEFRQGAGLTNAPAQVGPLVVSEIMYHPITGTGTNAVENLSEEFVEISNIGSRSISLGNGTATWRLREGVDLQIPSDRTLSPGEFALLVRFNPGDSKALSDFKTKYGITSAVQIFGPYSGKLDNGGERIELAQPLLVSGVDPDGPLPFVKMDSIEFNDKAPWPTNADGTGFSIQRINLRQYGNDPANWIGKLPTPGKSNTADADADGMPDDWETTYGMDVTRNDASLDFDRDGISNLNEFKIGTRPNDEASSLRFVSLVPSPLSTDLSFQGVEGIRYRVEYRNNLANGSWQTLSEVTAPSTGVVSVNDPAAGAGRFYRLLVP